MVNFSQKIGANSLIYKMRDYSNLNSAGLGAGGGAGPANNAPCNSAGGSPSPNYYAAKGTAALVVETAPPTAVPVAPFALNVAGIVSNLSNLASFRRGGSLDAQAQGGSTPYANYVFGVYMSAAGFSREQTLASANLYAALFSRYHANTPMDPSYLSTPAENIANITRGYSAQQGGTLCTP